MKHFLKLAAVLLSALMCLPAVGCTTGPAKSGEDTSASDTTVPNDSDPVTLEDYPYDLSQYITLGQYKGVEISPQEEDVTEEQLQQYLDNILQQNASKQPITDRPVQAGDTVNIDFSGKTLNIETPSGMEGTGYDLVLGSGSFIPGFEDAVVGHNIGETFDIDITFPDPYPNNPDLVNQPAVFTVTINSATETIVPELDDYFVASISDYKTVDEYKASVKLELYAQNVEKANSAKVSELWKKILEASVVNSYPETEIQAYIDEMISYYTDYATYNGYADLNAMLSEQYNMTPEQFSEETKTYAQSNAKEEMVLRAIIRAENISLTYGEYIERVSEYAQLYGFESVASLEEYYGKPSILQSVYWDKTLESLLEQAVVK